MSSCIAHHFPHARRVAAAGLLLLPATSLPACEPGGVGDPCVPDAEYSTTFAPFAIEELYFESRSLECKTRVCLVNHFQGRVSCPFGQESSESETGCTLPGEGPRGQRVEGAVPAWDLDRPPSRAVYCSCRCDGPDPDARYCECPSGFGCVELAHDWVAGYDGLKGSYCVKQGTEYRPTEAGGPTCADEPTNEACSEELPQAL